MIDTQTSVRRHARILVGQRTRRFTRHVGVIDRVEQAATTTLQRYVKIAGNAIKGTRPEQFDTGLLCERKQSPGHIAAGLQIRMYACIMMLSMQRDCIASPTRLHSIQSIGGVRKLRQTGVGITLSKANVERTIFGDGTRTS